VSTVTTTQPAAVQPRPWQATFQASITRVTGVDTVEEIDFSNSEFTRRTRVVGGNSPGVIVVLGEDDLRALLSDLESQLQAPPAGTDIVGLEVFVDLIEETLRTEPSHRFDSATFGAVAKDDTRDILSGHIGLGIDVAGTIRDSNHGLSIEQHVVVLPPGAFRPLSPADRASLAKALTAQPPADPLWKEILTDAQSG